MRLYIQMRAWHLPFAPKPYPTRGIAGATVVTNPVVAVGEPNKTQVGAPSLDLELLRALKGSPARRAVLRALAVLDPQRALNWVLSAMRAGVDESTTAQLRSIVEEIAAQAARERDAGVALRLAELLADQSLEATLPLIKSLTMVLSGADRLRLLGPVAASLAQGQVAEADVVQIAAEHAIAAGNADGAHRWLTQLGRMSSSPAVVQQVMRMRLGLPEMQGVPVRLALLSSFTIDGLKPFLDVECRASQLVPSLYLAPFNSWEREVRDPGSALYAFDPEIVFLSAAIDDLLGLSHEYSVEELLSLGSSAIDRVTSAVESLRAKSSCAIVVHNFLSAFTETGVMTADASRAQWLGALNCELAARLSTTANAFVLDLATLLPHAGGAADDAKLRHYARMRISHALLPELARAYVRFVVPWKGLARKCVIVDLDNTLWGGIIGEDGLSGIRLGDASPGSEYVELQHFLKGLINRGFILAVASKNNEADALEVLRHHDAMVLRESDFVTRRINWRPKPENVESIARELNIGLDAIVFIDDNPDERELMRQLLPQVLTVELPRDASKYRRVLERLPELQVLRVSAEDRERTQLYHARRDREQARESAGSTADFLASLDIRVELGRSTRATAARVHQLFQRTNQFNLTTRRYELTAVERSDSEWIVYWLRAADRFSDHGLVAAAIVRAGGRQWRIDNLVLSCRAIGYGIETAMLAHIAREARSAGAAELVGEFIPSAKNAPAADFFERHSFIQEKTDGMWVAQLDRCEMSAPSWVSVSTARES